MKFKKFTTIIRKPIPYCTICGGEVSKQVPYTNYDACVNGEYYCMECGLYRHCKDEYGGLTFSYMDSDPYAN